MPPVMGAGAFVMAEMLGVSYSDIALMAVIPALLYFLSISLMVYFEAHREGIPPLKGEDLPQIRAVLARGFHLLLPLVVLIYMLVILRYSPILSGLYAIVTLVVVASVVSVVRDRHFPLVEILSALRTGVVTAVPVALACATAGIVIGIVSMTGLGVRFTQLIVELSNGILWLGAVLTMIACIILGMGLPTTAAYVITAVLGAPALIHMGVPLMSAHMFIFYFAIVSFITPPVGLSAYAASGISGTNPMHTSFVAFKLGIAGFLVPFAFIYSPALLMQGSVAEILIVSGTALLAVGVLAGAIVGWFVMPLNAVLRLVFLASAIALIAPDPLYALLGIVAPVAVGTYASLTRRKRGLGAGDGSPVGREPAVE